MEKYQDKENLPLCLEAEDVQKTLGISRAAAYQIMHSDGFPLIKFGKRMLCMREDFFDWLDSKTERSGINEG